MSLRASVAIALFMCFFAGLLTQPSAIPATSASGATSGPPAARLQTITLAQFHQIQHGMTHDQVVEILGRDGYMQSSSSVAGIATAMVGWNNPGFMGGNISVMYQSDSERRMLVVMASQFGLK